MTGTVSLRSPRYGDVTDWLVGSKLGFGWGEMQCELERESDEQGIHHWFNYELRGLIENDHWEIDWSWQDHEAHGLNHQREAGRRKLFRLLGVTLSSGVSAVTERYDFARTQGAASFKLAVPRLGRVIYDTNFGGLEIWDVEVEYKPRQEKTIARGLGEELLALLTGEVRSDHGGRRLEPRLYGRFIRICQPGTADSTRGKGTANNTRLFWWVMGDVSWKVGK